MDTFPMSASDARIAARADEYAEYEAALQRARNADLAALLEEEERIARVYGY